MPKKKITEELIEKIKEAIIRNNSSGEEVANLFGVSTATVSRINQQIKKEKTLKLEKAYKILDRILSSFIEEKDKGMMIKLKEKTTKDERELLSEVQSSYRE